MHMKTHLHKLYGGISKEKRYGQVGGFLQENIFIDFPPKVFSYFFSSCFFLLLFSDSSPHFPPQDIFSVCLLSTWRFFSTYRFTDISIASLLLQCWSGLDCLGQFLFTLRVSSMGTISPSLPSWFCIILQNLCYIGVFRWTFTVWNSHF